MSRAFQRARRAAFVSDLMRLLRDQPTELLDFDVVQERLQLRGLVDRGLREIPLDEIVGTLGRAREFNRVFLPRHEELRERWQRVAELAEGTVGFPPIEVYQVGGAYFVIDGHHRVSVARQFGAETIEARVKEFHTRVPLSPEDSVETVLRREGLADFLEATGLEPRDGDELVTSVGNGYERLLEHIAVHRYYLSIEQSRAIGWREAVDHWHHHLYRPVVDLIEANEMARLVEGKTATDLYLYVMDRLHALRQRYGDDGATPKDAVEDAVEDLSRRHREEATPSFGDRVRSWWSPGDGKPYGDEAE